MIPAVISGQNLEAGPFGAGQDGKGGAGSRLLFLRFGEVRSRPAAPKASRPGGLGAGQFEVLRIVLRTSYRQATLLRWMLLGPSRFLSWRYT